MEPTILPDGSSRLGVSKIFLEETTPRIRTRTAHTQLARGAFGLRDAILIDELVVKPWHGATNGAGLAVPFRRSIERADANLRHAVDLDKRQSEALLKRDAQGRIYARAKAETDLVTPFDRLLGPRH